jgi:hypothetical protein
MEGEVMFHLGDPSSWVGTINIIQVHFGKIVPNVIIHLGWFMAMRERGLFLIK